MINGLNADINQIKQNKKFSLPPQNCHLVSSTPIRGHETLDFPWPSPITPHHQKDRHLSGKSSKETAQQFLEPPELTSQTAGANLEKSKPENFTKLVIIEDTDEEEENEMRVPLKTLNNLKPSLEKRRQSIKKQKLNVSFSPSNRERKAAVDQKNKGATKSQKEIKKNLKSLLEITEECAYDIINDQRQTTKRKQIEYSQRNKRNIGESLETLLEITEECEDDIKNQRQTLKRKHNEHFLRNKSNTFGKKQNKEVVELVNESCLKEKRNSVTVKTTVKEDRKNEENEKERNLIVDGKQKSLRLNLSQQHSTNKSTDLVNTQHTASETPSPAATEDKDGSRVEKSKKLSQESQFVEDSNSGSEVHTSTASRKRTLYSHERASFTVIEVSDNINSSKHYTYNYPFLEEEDNTQKDGANVQVQKSRVNSRKNAKRAKQSQNITKSKIQSKKAESAPKDDVNLRRSKRTRVKPLAYWIGERLCYKPGPDACFEIAGVEPPCAAEPIHRQRNNTREHIAFSIPLQSKENPQLKRVEIINEGRKEEVECFSTLRPVIVAEKLSKYKMLDSAVTEAGLIKLASSAKESFQASPAHYVFFILKGYALVQIQNMTQEVKQGELFQVPKGIPYSIENLSEKAMVLHFVMVK